MIDGYQTTTIDAMGQGADSFDRSGKINGRVRPAEVTDADPRVCHVKT